MDSVDEEVVVERMARELFAFRYSPLPTAGSTTTYEAAMKTRRHLWSSDHTVDQDRFRVLARAFLEIAFDGLEEGE